MMWPKFKYIIKRKNAFKGKYVKHDRRIFQLDTVFCAQRRTICSAHSITIVCWMRDIKPVAALTQALLFIYDCCYAFQKQFLKELMRWELLRCAHQLDAHYLPTLSHSTSPPRFIFFWFLTGQSWRSSLICFTSTGVQQSCPCCYFYLILWCFCSTAL